MKNGRPRPTFPPAQRYTQALPEAVQPPDDRTYSAEVTGFHRNLLHHRIARMVIPIASSIILSSEAPFVKHFFRIFHKNLPHFSVIPPMVFGVNVMAFFANTAVGNGFIRSAKMPPARVAFFIA
ncbi:MAG: hypothetical protein Q4F17_06685 [Eubacteriales bacterium]|nr:hypothetical protein [Eubacteriales bacterium]